MPAAETYSDPKRAEIGYGSASAGTAVLSPEVRRTPRTASAPLGEAAKGYAAPARYSAGHAHMTAYLLAVAELEYAVRVLAILYPCGTISYRAVQFRTRAVPVRYNFVSAYPFFLDSARSDLRYARRVEFVYLR